MSGTLTPESRGRLINLKTNLKSLNYGGDRPASGTSNQPYEVTPIPEGTEYLRDGMPLLSGPDFILRGGLTAPFAALKDVSRLVKMFTDTKSPRGIFFTLKENLLSRTSVKTQASFGAGYLGGVMNQGAYLPIGTILDAGLGWAGIHLNKFGINPVGSLGGPHGANKNARGGNLALNPYSVVVQNSQIAIDNRLVDLSKALTNGEEDNIRELRGLPSYKYNPKANEENPFTPVLYSYGGGPGSILGVGRTRIFKNLPTYNAIRNYEGLSTDSPFYSGIGSNDKKISPLLVGNILKGYISTNKDFKQGGGDLRSFSNYVIEGRTTELEGTNPFAASKIIHKAPNYTRQNKALRVGLGDPGRHATYAVSGSVTPIRTVFNYGIDASQMSALDKITALKPYEGEIVNANLPVDDLCTFNIAVIKNGASEGRNADYLHFRAYINGFTDNYGATWNDVQYVGRGNKFKSYGGFTRDISMGFTIAATSKAELTPMFTKLNFLASTLAPDYTSAGFMRGNIVRMTVGGYLHEVPGVLTSLTYTIPDDTTWEIGIDTEGNSDPSVKELPHRIEVSLAFTPIEDFLPSRQTLSYEDGELVAMGDQRFISLKNGDGNLYEGIGNYINKVRDE
tara:strand:- start:4760 stop:6625 length:1866 start_codon:yes stop_codon:yes gene_type:complete